MPPIDEVNQAATVTTFADSTLRDKLRVLYAIVLARAATADSSVPDLAAFMAMDERIELLAEAAEKAMVAHLAPNGDGDGIDLAAVQPAGRA